jgi:hypothetical protein
LEAQRPPNSEQLIVIEVNNACGCVLIRTGWDVVTDPHGRRVTHCQTIASEQAFKKRLAALGEILWVAAGVDQRSAREVTAALLSAATA